MNFWPLPHWNDLIISPSCINFVSKSAMETLKKKKKKVPNTLGRDIMPLLYWKTISGYVLPQYYWGSKLKPVNILDLVKVRTEGQNRSVERSIISELECCHFIAWKLTAMQQVKKNRMKMETQMYLQTVTEYLRLTLVFIWNSALQEMFNCYFSRFFCYY